MKKTLLVSAMLLPLALVAGTAFAHPAPGACSATTFLTINSPTPITLPFGTAGVPGNHGDITASIFYLEDRGGAAVNPVDTTLGQVFLPSNPLVNGYVSAHRPGYGFGSGTWLYAESNGFAGLQRGGFSQLPDSPLTGVNDPEIAACVTATPDTLIF
jgi:hypothetical protein